MMTGETINDEGLLEEDLLPRFPVRLVQLANGKVDKVPMWKDWANRATMQCPWLAGDVPGVPMGWRSGLVLVDVDGEEAEAWLIEQIAAGRIPETRHHRTTRGYHLCFRYAGGFTNRTGIRPGVDFKTDEGFACWWPKRGRPWEDRPIAELPEVVRELLRDAHGAAGGSVARAVSNSKGTLPISAADTIGKLDPCAFRDYTKWLHLMMACHAAGIEREAFVEWSISDPLYANDAESVRRQWNGLKAEGSANGRVSEATLFAALRDAKSKEQPVQQAPMPSPPKGRRRMSYADTNELSRMLRWLTTQKEDEGALFWIACRLGEWRMKFVSADHVLEDMVVATAWQAGLRNKARVRRQVRNGMRIGALEWLDRNREGDGAGRWGWGGDC
jgi:hypothetical protein